MKILCRHTFTMLETKMICTCASRTVDVILFTSVDLVRKQVVFLRRQPITNARLFEDMPT